MNARIDDKGSSGSCIPLHRLEWPDLAKGLAMILVVTGHVLGGLMTGHFIPNSALGLRAYDWIYLFHVPTLFFVSGWLVEFRAKVKGPTRIKSIFATLLYPYFLWGVIIWAMHVAGASLANMPVDPWRPLRMFYVADAGPWFLLILFLLHALNRVLEPLEHRPGWLLVIGLLAFLDLASFNFAGFSTTLSHIEKDVVFYALGVWLAAQGRLVDGHANKIALLGGMGFMALLGWLCWFGTDLPLWSRLPLGMAGIAGIVGLSLGLTSLPGTQWIDWLGRHSLAIYVLHGFAPPVTRWLLTRQLGVTSAAWLLLAGVAAGLLSSATVAWAVERWQLKWIFTFGGNRPQPSNL